MTVFRPWFLFSPHDEDGYIRRSPSRCEKENCTIPRRIFLSALAFLSRTELLSALRESRGWKSVPSSARFRVFLVDNVSWSRFALTSLLRQLRFQYMKAKLPQREFTKHSWQPSRKVYETKWIFLVRGWRLGVVSLADRDTTSPFFRLEKRWLERW
jgi:hypothetical protein